MALPTHSSAVEEKLERQNRANGSFSAWTRPVSLPIPGVRSRRLRILLPNAVASSLNHFRVARMRRKRGPVFIAFTCFALFFTVVLVNSIRRRGSCCDGGNANRGEPPTLVFKREDLQKIWKWEIESGHYPSTHPCTFALLLFF